MYPKDIRPRFCAVAGGGRGQKGELKKGESFKDPPTLRLPFAIGGKEGRQGERYGDGVTLKERGDGG